MLTFLPPSPAVKTAGSDIVANDGAVAVVVVVVLGVVSTAGTADTAAVTESSSMLSLSSSFRSSSCCV